MICGHHIVPPIGICRRLAALLLACLVVLGVTADNPGRLNGPVGRRLLEDARCISRSAVLPVNLPESAPELPSARCGVGDVWLWWLAVRVVPSGEVVRNVSICDKTQVVVSNEVLILALANVLDAGRDYDVLLGYPEGLNSISYMAFSFQTCPEDLRRPEALRVFPTGLWSQLRLLEEVPTVLFSKRVFPVTAKYIRVFAGGAVLYKIDVTDGDCGDDDEDGCVLVDELTHSVAVYPRGMHGGSIRPWTTGGVRYLIQAEAGAFVDADTAVPNGNALISWYVEASSDIDGPELQKGVPAGNATMSLRSFPERSIRLQFDEPVFAATKDVAVKSLPFAGDRTPELLEVEVSTSGSHQTVALRFDTAVQNSSDHGPYFTLYNASNPSQELASIDDVVFAGNFAMFAVQIALGGDVDVLVLPSTAGAVVSSSGVSWDGSSQVRLSATAGTDAPSLIRSTLSDYACISASGQLPRVTLQVSKALATVSKFAYIILVRCPDAGLCTQQAGEVLWSLSAASTTTDSTLRVDLDPTRPFEVTLHLEELPSSLQGSSYNQLDMFRNHLLVLEPGLLRDFNMPALSNFRVTMDFPICEVQLDERSGSLVYVYSPKPIVLQDSLPQRFEVLVGADSFEDEWGNPVLATSHIFFEETVNPQLVPEDCNPPNAALAVPTENVVLAFSEPMQAGEGSFELWRIGASSADFEVDVAAVFAVTSDVRHADASGRYVSITPRTLCSAASCGNLEVGQTYFLRTSARGVLKDLSGNLLPQLSTEGSWSFTVAAESLRQPTIVFAGTLTAAIGQGTSPPVLTGHIYFSEQVVLSNTSASITLKACDTNLDCDIEEGTRQFSTRDFEFGSGEAKEAVAAYGLLTFRLTSWPVRHWINRRYAVTLPRGLVRSSASPSLVAPAEAFTAFYDVGEVVVPTSDTTAPVIVHRIPENGAAFVAANTSITLTFDEEIEPGIGSLQLCLNDNVVQALSSTSELAAACVPGRLSNGEAAVQDVAAAVIDRRSITFAWAEPLATGQTLFVVVPTGIVQDTSGNSWNRLENTMYSFTIRDEEPDTVPPVLTTCQGGSCIQPLPGEQDWPQAATLVLELSELVQPGSGALVVEAASMQQAIEVRWGVNDEEIAQPVIDGNRVLIALPELTPNMSYDVRLQDDFVRDMVGLPLAAYEFNFSTAPSDTEPPELLSKLPSTDYLARSSLIVLIFSEAVYTGSTNISISSNESEVVTALTASAVEILGSIVRLSLAGLDLVAGSLVNISLPHGAFVDSAGNPTRGEFGLQWVLAPEVAVEYFRPAVGQEPASGAAFLSYAGGLLLHGGRTQSGCSNETYMFEPGNGWQRINAIAHARLLPAMDNPAVATSEDGCVYMLGGECYEASSAIWRSCNGLMSWQPLTGSQEAIADIPLHGGINRSHAIAVIGGWQVVIVDTASGMVWACLDRDCDAVVRTSYSLPFYRMTSPLLVASADNSLFLFGGELDEIWMSPYSLHVGASWQALHTEGLPAGSSIVNSASAGVLTADDRAYILVQAMTDVLLAEVSVASNSAAMLSVKPLAVFGSNASMVPVGLAAIENDVHILSIAEGEPSLPGCLSVLRTYAPTNCAVFQENMDVACSSTTCSGSPPTLGSWNARQYTWRAPSLDGALCQASQRGVASLPGDAAVEISLTCPCPYCNMPVLLDPPEEYTGLIDTGEVINAVGPTVRMTCSTGFRASASLACHPNGTFDSYWQLPFPTCIERECLEPPPLVADQDACALISQDNPLPPNGTCPLQCAAGLRAREGVEEPSYTCRYGAYESTGCDRQTCDVLPPVANGSIVCPRDPALYGDECFLRCHAGYFLQGNASVPCGVNSTVPETPPHPIVTGVCLPLPCDAFTPEDVFAVVKNYSEDHIESLVVGSTAEVGCSLGYTIRGMEGHTATFQCRPASLELEEAVLTWEPSVPFSCVKQVCSGLPEASEGAQWACDGTDEGDVCTLVCDQGYEATTLGQVECSNGVFSGAAVQNGVGECTLVSCPSLPEVSGSNGSTCPSEVYHGDTCTVLCTDGYEARGRYSCFDGLYETVPVCVPPGWTSWSKPSIWSTLSFEIYWTSTQGEDASTITFQEQCEEAIIDAFAPWRLSEVVVEVRDVNDIDRRRLQTSSTAAQRVKMDFKVGSTSNHSKVLSMLRNEQTYYRKRFEWSMEARLPGVRVATISLSQPRLVEEIVAQAPVGVNHTISMVHHRSSTAGASVGEDILMVLVGLLLGSIFAVLIVFSLWKTGQKTQQRRRTRDQELLWQLEDPMYMDKSYVEEAYTAQESPLAVQSSLHTPTRERLSHVSPIRPADVSPLQSWSEALQPVQLEYSPPGPAPLIQGGDVMVFDT